MKDISLHLMDIVQNSVKAGADRMKICFQYTRGMLLFKISDNGSGMEKDILKRASDPFTTTRTTRKVGLGIPLLKQSAEITGGYLKLASEKQKGTVLEAGFVADSIDRIPLGDIAETMKALIYAYPGLDYEIRFQNANQRYELKTTEVKSFLQGVSIKNPDILNWIEENIREGIIEIFGGVLNEISG